MLTSCAIILSDDYTISRYYQSTTKFANNHYINGSILFETLLCRILKARNFHKFIYSGLVDFLTVIEELC